MNDSLVSIRLYRTLHARDLVTELVIRNIKLRYQHSILGVIWAILNPLAYMLAFNLIRGAFRMSIENYALFALTGIVAWNWFQDGLMLSTNSITGNRELVTRPNFPLTLLPLVGVLTALVDLLVAIPLLLIFVGIEGMTGALLTLPLVMIPQFFLILGIGYILAALNVTYRDINHLAGVSLRLLFFLTPIFYDANAIPGKLRMVFYVNPMAYFINAYRTILVQGEYPEFFPLIILFIAALLIVLLGYTIFNRASMRFIEEL
ncbi:MAG: ABC transporter permease [Anaerolineales bacterium]|nr:ABC transporter permease [Anaerolineales bacterium]